jgi:hypothetical protein
MVGIYSEYQRKLCGTRIWKDSEGNQYTVTTVYETLEKAKEACEATKGSIVHENLVEFVSSDWKWERTGDSVWIQSQYAWR